MQPDEAPAPPADRCHEIEGPAVDAAVRDWTGLAASATLTWLEGGQISGLDRGVAWPGVALANIRPGSLYDQMGLRDGDVVYALHGYSLYGQEYYVQALSNPEASERFSANLAAVEPGLISLALPQSFSVAVVRGGEPITLTQVLAGSPRAACQHRVALKERDANERAAADADRRARDEAEMVVEQADMERAIIERAVAAPDPAEAARDARRRQDELRGRVVAGIEARSETSFAVDVAVLPLLDDTVVGRARFVPHIRGGKQEGIRVYAVRPHSVIAALGLRNGDTILSLNGVAVMSADELTELFAGLGDATSFSLALRRRDQPVTLDYTVEASKDRAAR